MSTEAPSQESCRWSELLPRLNLFHRVKIKRLILPRTSFPEPLGCEYPLIADITPMERLPDEIRLHILSYVAPSDLWHSVRHVNQQYGKYAEEVASKQHVPNFNVGLNFTLGSGSAHRWYDVRGTITTSFRYINKINSQYALFEITEVLPEASSSRVVEKWKRMCASGFGPEQEWRVTFRGDGILMKMPNLVLSANDGIWCDWREMMEGYIERLPEAWSWWRGRAFDI
jgi:hypothetical protein